MKTKNRIFLGMASFAVAVITACAAFADDTNTVAFRTTGYFVGLAQGTNQVTGKPMYDSFCFDGHNLVNLAMGRNISDHEFPAQVLAMTFECDLSTASLVVYDLTNSSVLATIATTTMIDSVKQQDLNQPGPNRAHFVAVMQLGSNGNDTNGILGGYFTVAGRLNLDPQTGCPHPVLVVIDRDPWDKLVDDQELPSNLDPDEVPLITRTGLAHLIGVIDAVDNGTKNRILVPHGALSIRRELPLGPVASPVASE